MVPRTQVGDLETKPPVHRLWANQAIPGEAAQVLPTPAHFEQVSQLVDVETATDGMACGPDVEDFVKAVRPYLEAGVDERCLFLDFRGPPGLGDEVVIEIERRFHMYQYGISIHMVNSPATGDITPTTALTLSRRAR